MELETQDSKNNFKFLKFLSYHKSAGAFIETPDSHGVSLLLKHLLINYR